MASTNKTSNFLLNSWVGSDPVLREDFNADNVRLDAALTAHQSALEALRSGLRQQGYNTYGLMLTSHYEGRYTGMKRALIVQAMDSYREVASKTACAVDVAQGYAEAGTLTGAAIATYDVSETGTTRYDNDDRAMALNSPVYQQLALKGPWQLTGIRLRMYYLYSLGATVGQRLRLYAADANGAPTGAPLATATLSYAVSGSTRKMDLEFLFPSALTLAPGEYVAAFDFTSMSTSSLEYLPYYIYGTVNEYSHACLADGTARADSHAIQTMGSAVTQTVAAGTLVMRQTDVLCDYDSVCAYFRHNGHPPTVELSADGGTSWQTLTAAETVTLSGPDGRSSYETSYTLAEAPAAPNRQVTLRIGLSAGSAENARLYDYGVVFL